MKLFSALLLLAASLLPCAQAQVAPSIVRNNFNITVGGTANVFQPDFADSWENCTNNICYASPEHSPYPLIGAGAFVDFKFTRHIQIEAEGRWLRFNQFDKIRQDNYLIGPRVPLLQLRRFTLYGKVLGGFTKMNFDPQNDHGAFTTIAYGGGIDTKLTKRLSVRLPDFEYQYWPKWEKSILRPYGASVGISYRVF